MYWGTQWRPDQKEPQLRETAARRGIADFFGQTPCLTVRAIHRLPPEAPLPADDVLSGLAGSPAPERLILIVVRELGPRLVIGLPVIVEGGTEVVVDVKVLDPRQASPLANTQTHWRHGGPFVIKGVGSLASDMNAALAATLGGPAR